MGPDQLAELDALAKRMGCKRPEVLRRGIPYLVRHLEAAEAGQDLTLQMSGDEATLRWKNHVIELANEGKGVPRCAREAKVTQRTVYNHLARDPVFRELFEEARNFCVDSMEGCLYKIGTREKNPNVTAMLAYLNAHHPDYGMIRSQVLQRILGPFLDRIVKLATQYVPPGLLDEFVTKLGRDAERVAIDATSGRG